MANKPAASPLVAFWLGEIDTYESKFKTWDGRARKIVKRYRDEREQNNRRAQFNILWSNVQTLHPALYARPPKPNVDRRFQDDDHLGRVSAQVLERAVSYFVGQDIFDETMKQVVLDRLLPGRGTAWVRYVPSFKQGEPTLGTTDDEPTPELETENTLTDYVHWEDFGHTWGRTWQEVRAVWRRAYLDRAALVKRFGEYGQKVPLDAKMPGAKEDTPDSFKKAIVYEIWDKQKREVIWVAKGCDKELDVQADPLRLQDFFPCPKPLFATLANDTLVPTPDYLLYQDQARELDMLTGRIDAITKALKVAGVYDASAPALDRLLGESVENTLIAVDKFAVLGDKGGLKGVVDLLPMQDIINTLLSLYDAREKVKQDIYEITGISDIIRGSTNAAETATAQEIKGKFATLRLDNMQGDVARFARDLVRIQTEIIAEHFSIETIKQLCGIKLLTDAEKQMVQAQSAQAEAMGQPIPDELAELLKLPSWEQVEAVIRDDTARSFRIDIETDSTIKLDQDAEKQSRIEFLTSAGAFLQTAVTLPPELAPLAMELFMFGARGFKVTRDLETTMQTTLDKIKTMAENPPPVQPDPALAQQEKDFALKEKEYVLKERDMALKEKSQSDLAAKEMAQIDADTRKAKWDAKTKVAPDVALSDPDFSEGGITPVSAQLTDVVAGLGAVVQITEAAFARLSSQQQQGFQAVIQAISAPKKVLRDAQGRIAGVELETMQ